MTPKWDKDTEAWRHEYHSIAHHQMQLSFIVNLFSSLLHHSFYSSPFIQSLAICISQDVLYDCVVTNDSKTLGSLRKGVFFTYSTCHCGLIAPLLAYIKALHMLKKVTVLVTHVLCPVVHQSPLSIEFSRQEYWSGLPFLLQGIFPT